MEGILLIFKSVILGIVEGVTEFLPVSSTGHLVIFQNLIGFGGTSTSYVDMYTYVIQLGAILAVIILYWKRIKDTLVNFSPKKVGYEKSGFKFWFMIFIACIPGGILGVLFDDLAEKYLFAPIPVAITLFVGAILMILAENKFRNNTSKGKELNVTIKQAFIIGVFQCLAIIPGMSRSASTIIGGWISGLSTVAAAEFSFFLAIPVMVGMSILKIIKIGGLFTLTSQETVALAVGFVVSFIVALIVIDKFIAYLKKRPMRIFAVYRIIFAIVVLIAGFSGIF
ncbi:undecaprenyl-diphosphatase [Clostridium pasteurianum DSM 525 = ATCC 6013]|uniref:Undecaprenyl-diphosphatase n=1 Tax=Clostridium pasteurianum DSM 525 = ATCC 6013 TaxID=1262449 RepID=A0A0H3J0T0_CLOPA|nr:undecaprenyl-diphosphate phosphatase [Clostridium pasteurianum]AJA47451.1 undecaprenyl-diphosphatase [Clostridium pasteurianum DSM 525 = ATCC 6013]AJA51439.1 undecaprenyl-diphosphatase [Clostridium pasteurianum DSM 525 = ATCC 6013]AOZ74776.1 UDP-diphosphatase [Clostridium pasteurianum DSM 525 = ATCC 6013]AOZ78572.1 UDP-diphosphatase [Clostridium pasteurianum]ELP58786.1 Undecaprenyl-diphosphatase [Clostridium pasteurianum DSM 525 = ATCC 6013]